MVFTLEVAEKLVGEEVDDITKQFLEAVGQAECEDSGFVEAGINQDTFDDMRAIFVYRRPLAVREMEIIEIPDVICKEDRVLFEVPQEPVLVVGKDNHCGGITSATCRL